MATPKGDHKPTQCENPWLFSEGIFLCAILIRKHVTQHPTHMPSYGLFQEFRLRGWRKRCEQENQRGGWGKEWEHRISVSLSSRSPLIFSPVCDFAPHFTNCPEQASSLATSHIVISNNISFLPLLNLDLSLLYWQLPPPPPETNHIKGWMQMDSALQCVIRDHNRLTDMLPDIQKTVKRNVCGVPLCNF